MNEAAFFARGRILLSMLACAAPALLGGCSSNEGMKKQMKSLETQITAMRADQDRLEERLAAMELSASVPKRGVEAAPAAARIERPRLKVIHLGPEDEESDHPVDPPASSAPDSAAHRPIIRGTGDRVIKTGDADSGETTNNDGADGRPVAQLGRDSRRN